MLKVGGDYLRSPEKRGFDLAVASAVAVPMGLTAAALLPFTYLENGGAWFEQPRVGYGDLIEECEECGGYKVYPDMIVTKIQTMPNDTERTGISVTGCKHPDAGPVSTVARVVRADEVPQLRKVFSGEMSAVGLRPRTVEDMERILDSLSPREQRAWLEARKMAKPGLAHPGAADQYRDGYGYNTVKIAHDETKYALEASLLVDLEILSRIAAGLASAIGRKFKLDLPGGLVIN